ncbi:hypothetical protein [Geomonas paludis]|uniref:Uncharacterized protein n=1 Tax=Geomonas paludis TaxID=2740185 RepID=A0A6V8MQJ6_9BACT|nr:hypothetical protein [Geomonas paludis]GFO62335.1 hypothetical protein GMPD_02540 [Geomonas paludis]
MQLVVPFYMLDGKMWIPGTPWEAGEYEGAEWAKTTSATSLRNAAERLTTNEQIEQHVSWCNQCENNGQRYTGKLKVTHPAEFGSDAELKSFYHNLTIESSCYQGNDPDIKIGNCIVTGVPGHNLRQFEDGFAAAVRKHWNHTKQGA